MREYRHDPDETSLRPKAARPEEEPLGREAAAAAAGRTDVLSAVQLLRLQRSVGNAGVGAAVEDDRSPVLDVVSTGGRPLEEPVRHDMESRLGHDFGDVRIHDDGAAHSSAQSVAAHAYTVGSHVVFQRDAYDPTSSDGQRTLAHELTHVVQQRSGPVDGSPTAGGIRVSDPADRFEREASARADQAMTTSPVQSAPVQRQEAESVAVQRQGAPEEDLDEEPTAQGLFVQREDEAEEERDEAGT